MGDSGMAMGDLVLTMDEVSPVMKKLIEGGIEVTALHNQLLRNQPFTMHMHVLCRGDPVKLAAALHIALAESKTPLSAVPSAPAAAPPPNDLDTAAIDAPLGAPDLRVNCGFTPAGSIARGRCRSQSYRRHPRDEPG
jgi:hypothetical protein